jgi:hypothetical protein
LGLVLFAESITVSLRPNCVLERVENFTRVWVVIRIFWVSPQQSPWVIRATPLDPYLSPTQKVGVENKKTHSSRVSVRTPILEGTQIPPLRPLLRVERGAPTKHLSPPRPPAAAPKNLPPPCRALSTSSCSIRQPSCSI